VIQSNAFVQNTAFIVVFTTFWFSVIFLVSCKNEPKGGTERSLTDRQLVLLDSVQASRAILDDDATAFFQRISKLDMALQMQRNYPAETAWSAVLADYRAFLQRDVANFSPGEAIVLREILSTLKKQCDALKPEIFPQQLELIKTKGQHYGDGVYYTRENRIIIPANELEYLDRERLCEVLLHEIFHIYARYHPHQQRALYALIGFRELPGELALPSAVASRLLLNPDGVDMGYAIDLAMANADTARCVPVLTANAPAFLPEREAYFDYVDFNLYPVREQADGSFIVIADSLGRSPIQVNQQPDFFRQISDNTLYIIHPDEILADNFKWLVLSKSGERRYRLERFSEAGQALLRQMETVLKK